MLLSVKGVVRATVLALVVGLSCSPVLVTSATAAAPSEARTSTACAQATEVLAEKRAKKKKAKKRYKAAKKKLRKAKRTDRGVKKTKRVKKAKKKVRKTRKKLRRSKRQVAAARTDRAAKCQSTGTPTDPAPDPTAEQQAEALGGLLAVLLGGTGADPVTMTVEQLRGVLELIVPGLADQLDPAILQALFEGFGGTDLDPATLAELLGGGFDPALLTELLAGFGGGDLTPPELPAVLQQLTDQLAGLAPGAFPAPELTPEGLGDLLDGLLETVGLGQLGQLLQMLLAGADDGSLPGELSPEALTALLTSFGAGPLDASQFTALLNGVNGGGFDATALAGLIDGGLDGGQLDGLAESLDPAFVEMILAQLAGFSLDGFGLPADPVTGTEAEALQQAITEIVSVLAAALAGGTDAPTLEDIPLLSDLIGTLFCSLLPLLCL